MTLLSPVWSRSFILVAVIFGGLSFFAHPGLTEGKRTRLEVRALVSELFIHEALAGRSTLEEYRAECALPDNEISCESALTRPAIPLVRRLSEIQQKALLPPDAVERRWLAVLGCAGFDLGPESEHVPLGDTNKSNLPGWLVQRCQSMSTGLSGHATSSDLHNQRMDTWRLFQPWAFFFMVLSIMSILGLASWFAHKRILQEQEGFEERARVIQPVDALGYVGLWVLFRLVWGGLFPLFQLDSALSIVLMDYLPHVIFGFFLVHHACSRLELPVGALGIRVPTGSKAWAKMFGVSLLVFMMALPLVFFCHLVSNLIWDPMDAMAPFVLRLYEDQQLFEFALVSVLAAPVFEEFLFRGFLFSSLRGRYKARTAIFVQGAAFALLHFNPVAFLPLLALGVLLGKLRESTTSIVPCITVHALWNGSVSLVTYFQLGA